MANWFTTIRNAVTPATTANPTTKADLVLSKISSKVSDELLPETPEPRDSLLHAKPAAAMHAAVSAPNSVTKPQDQLKAIYKVLSNPQADQTTKLEAVAGLNATPALFAAPMGKQSLLEHVFDRLARQTRNAKAGDVRPMSETDDFLIASVLLERYTKVASSAASPHFEKIFAGVAKSCLNGSEQLRDEYVSRALMSSQLARGPAAQRDACVQVSRSPNMAQAADSTILGDLQRIFGSAQAVSRALTIPSVKSHYNEAVHDLVVGAAAHRLDIVIPSNYFGRDNMIKTFVRAERAILWNIHAKTQDLRDKANMTAMSPTFARQREDLELLGAVLGKPGEPAPSPETLRALLQE